MPKVLIFTLAARGYHWLYRDNLESQREYAQRHGYTYSVVDRPQLTTLGLDVAWLKIHLIKKALSMDFDWVFFIDADAKIQPNCPPILDLQQQEKSIYVANGYSGRINSGVLIIKNDVASRNFFNTVLSHRDHSLPPEDDVGWGENGHIIHFAKANASIAIISKHWNNNSDAKLNDYIRHYSAGPLRKLYKPRAADFIRHKALNYFLAVLTRTHKLFNSTETIDNKQLHNICHSANFM